MCENLDMPGSTLRTPDPKVLPVMARFSHMAVWLKRNLNARGAEPTPLVGAGRRAYPWGRRGSSRLALGQARTHFCNGRAPAHAGGYWGNPVFITPLDIFFSPDFGPPVQLACFKFDSYF